MNFVAQYFLSYFSLIIKIYLPFLPNIIHTGQKLTKLLQISRGPIFIGTQCMYSAYHRAQVVVKIQHRTLH